MLALYYVVDFGPITITACFFSIGAFMMKLPSLPSHTDSARINITGVSVIDDVSCHLIHDLVKHHLAINLGFALP